MPIQYQLQEDEHGNAVMGPDGRPAMQAVVPADENGESHAVLTGPATGVVVLDNGTSYDVTPAIIQVRGGDGIRVAYHIAKQHEASGKLEEWVHGTEGAACSLAGDACTGARAVVIGTEDSHTIGHEGDDADIVDAEVVPAPAG